MTWIQLYNGKRFDILEPDPDVLDIETIAVSLARTCRFRGHTTEFYSVAQHSILVADILDFQSPYGTDDDKRRLMLAALLHDAHEALNGFGDVARPAKLLDRYVGQFLDEVHQRIDAAVAKRFDLELPTPSEVKWADNIALATEARDLMLAPPCPWAELPPPWPHLRLVPWTIEESRRRFLDRYERLTADRK